MCRTTQCIVILFRVPSEFQKDKRVFLLVPGFLHCSRRHNEASDSDNQEASDDQRSSPVSHIQHNQI